MIGVPFREYSPAFLKVRTKTAELVDFKLNNAQERLDKIIEDRLAEGKPVRIIVLKARQLGFSTYSLGRMYHKATTSENIEALMIAHDEPSSLKLFDRLKLMHTFAPEKPMQRYSTRRELDFRNPDPKTAEREPGLLSRCTVATAGRENVGRSDTLQYLHVSELAFWRDADIRMLGLEQAVPRAPNTIEIIESTANGVGNEFHKRWKRAENPKTAGDWIGVFFAWWVFPEYEMEPEDGIMQPVPSCISDVEEFEKDEQRMAKLHGWGDRAQAKINWRRWCIANQCGNKLERFHQEYPSNPDEAFLTSGRPVFNQQKVMHRIEVLEKADQLLREQKKPARYDAGNIKLVSGAAQFSPHPEGMLRVYRWPERHRRYTIGADVAEGIVKGDDPDESAAHVFERFTWEQVATFQGLITPTEFAKVLIALGYWYNTALLVPEANNHGHTVCVRIEEQSYPRFYMRQEFDALGNKTLEKAGWLTNKTTRPILVDALDDAVNSNSLKVHDIPTLQQMLTFVHNEKTGKPEGAAGCHDDLVMAGGIACAAMNWGDHVTRASSSLPLHVDPNKAAVITDIRKHIAIRKRQRRIAHGGKS